MENIAIIGIGSRFPGAKTPEAFWYILRNGIDTITEVPPERWDIDAFYDPEPNTPGKMNTRRGGFINKESQFDSSFFGISPRGGVHGSSTATAFGSYLGGIRKWRLNTRSTFW